MDEDAIIGKLVALLACHSIDGKLRTTCPFADSGEALAWMVRVGFLAEQHGYHPDIDNRRIKGTLVLVARCRHHTYPTKPRRRRSGGNAR